jgi:hypothetical protein
LEKRVTQGGKVLLAKKERKEIPVSQGDKGSLVQLAQMAHQAFLADRENQVQKVNWV